MFTTLHFNLTRRVTSSPFLLSHSPCSPSGWVLASVSMLQSQGGQRPDQHAHVLKAKVVSLLKLYLLLRFPPLPSALSLSLFSLAVAAAAATSSPRHTQQTPPAPPRAAGSGPGALASLPAQLSSAFPLPLRVTSV